MTRSQGDVTAFQRLMRRTSETRLVAWANTRVLRWHHIDRAVFRLTNGRKTVSGALSGSPLLMLTTTGARSGVRRTVPVLGLPDGDRWVVIASNYARQANPSWYHNLRACPDATMTLAGSPPRAVRAHEAVGAERDRLWALGVRTFPPWARYERQVTGRRIPIMVLESAGGRAPE
ncbi:nitroreductase family deazaflavin-dependent oxidoreductase [Rhodococcus sp. NPDC003348]